MIAETDTEAQKNNIMESSMESQDWINNTY